MFFVNILFLAGFCWSPVHRLITYLRGPEEKPKPSEVIGILTITAVMAAYLIWLMSVSYFF